jgi:hypothetical protein
MAYGFVEGVVSSSEDREISAANKGRRVKESGSRGLAT